MLRLIFLDVMYFVMVLGESKRYRGFILIMLILSRGFIKVKDVIK